MNAPSNPYKTRPAEAGTFTLALAAVIGDVMDGGKFHSATNVKLLVIGAVPGAITLWHDHVWPWATSRWTFLQRKPTA